MTLLSSRVGMIHRCDTERDQNLGTPDAWGNPSTPDWETNLTGQVCRAFTQAVRQPIEAQEQAFIETRTIIVPVDADITEQDRITDVTDTGGNVIFHGPMIIRGRLAYRDHAELAVEQVR